MHKYILAVTRFIVGLATALHLTGLKALIAAGDRRVAKADSKHDLAIVLHHAAQDTLAVARVAVRDARNFRKSVANEVAAIRAAAVAEADTLSANHTVA